jgi:hypothetical protein
MHICVYNTAYGYIRVARYTSAAVVTIVDLFFMRQKKKLNIELRNCAKYTFACLKTCVDSLHYTLGCSRLLNTQ